MADIDPLVDFKNIIINHWSDSGSGGTLPVVDITQDYRTLDVNTDYVALESLSEGDSFNGIGAVDYKRDVGINVHVWTTASDRTRIRQMLENVRNILRHKANWRLVREDSSVANYDNVSMSITRDLSDEVRNVKHFSFDITAWHFEAIQ